MRIIKNTQRRAAGFTLVEVLVAMTLFSLVLVMVFNGLHSAGLNRKRGENRVEKNDYQRLELGFMRRVISQAVPLFLIDSKWNPILFQGNPDSLRFISGLPSHRGGGGLYMMDIHLEQRKAGRHLLLGYSPMTPETDFFSKTGPERDTLILAPDIVDIELNYYGSLSADDESHWYNTWVSREFLPELIRIQITPAESSQLWPEIQVPIHAHALKGQPQFTLFAGPMKDGDQGIYSDTE